jgi:hypothetical protein
MSVTDEKGMHSPTRSKKLSKRKVFLLDIDATPLSFLRANFNSLPNLSRIFQVGRVFETQTPASLLSAALESRQPGCHRMRIRGRKDGITRVHLQGDGRVSRRQRLHGLSQ